jgi:hypothetical protein
MIPDPTTHFRNKGKGGRGKKASKETKQSRGGAPHSHTAAAKEQAVQPASEEKGAVDAEQNGEAGGGGAAADEHSEAPADKTAKREEQQPASLAQQADLGSYKEAADDDREIKRDGEDEAVYPKIMVAPLADAERPPREEVVVPMKEKNKEKTSTLSFTFNLPTQAILDANIPSVLHKQLGDAIKSSLLEQSISVTGEAELLEEFTGRYNLDDVLPQKVFNFAVLVPDRRNLLVWWTLKDCGDKVCFLAEEHSWRYIKDQKSNQKLIVVGTESLSDSSAVLPTSSSAPATSVTTAPAASSEASSPTTAVPPATKEIEVIVLGNDGDDDDQKPMEEFTVMHQLQRNPGNGGKKGTNAVVQYNGIKSVYTSKIPKSILDDEAAGMKELLALTVTSSLVEETKVWTVSVADTPRAITSWHFLEGPPRENVRTNA